MQNETAKTGARGGFFDSFTRQMKRYAALRQKHDLRPERLAEWPAPEPGAAG